MKNVILKTLSVAAFVAIPVVASAQVSANISMTSNYKFRGQDQGNNKIALQGGFDYAHASGLYAGVWSSTIGFTNAGIETDLYGGYKGTVGGLGYDVGFLTYIYPGASPLKTDEIYGALSYGPFTAKYSHTISDEYFGVPDSKGTGYINLAYAQEVVKDLTLKASYGRTNFDGNSGVDYADYSVGASYNLGDGFSLGGAVVGANKRSTYGVINKSRLIVTLTKAM